MTVTRSGSLSVTRPVEPRQPGDLVQPMVTGMTIGDGDDHRESLLGRVFLPCGGYP